MGFDRNVLALHAAAVTEQLVSSLRRDVLETLHRRGAVIGISGGVDSSVVLLLCTRALGADKVLGVMLPEQDSSPSSARLARLVADCVGVRTLTEDLTVGLEGLGCYARRDEAIRNVFPEYGPGYKARLTLPGNVLDSDTLALFYLTVITPGGEEKSARLNPRDYAQIVAASNLKQRSRMSMLYYHAELRNYAVVGTPNKNEHDQGFFVKWGDGAYDVAPIRHLYKSQVYQLAEYLDVPQEIREAIPTTDTYSAPTSQEEFFFRMPFLLMDLLWYALEHGVPPSEVAPAMNLSEDQVRRAFRELTRKQQATRYLRSMPLHYD